MDYHQSRWDLHRSTCDFGEVEQFGPHDSQRRFQNDLKIDNLIAKTSGDYDGDGFQ